jgi:hypothetical protein
MRLTASPYYRIEYWNKLWNNWLDFDNEFYKNESSARKVVEDYKQSVPDIKIRITQTNILSEKPKRTSRKNLGTKVTVEKA